MRAYIAVCMLDCRVQSAETKLLLMGFLIFVLQLWVAAGYAAISWFAERYDVVETILPFWCVSVYQYY